MTTAIQIYNPRYARAMHIIEKAVKICKALEYINTCTKRLKRVDNFKCKKKKKGQQFRLTCLLRILISMSWAEISVIMFQPFEPMPTFVKGGIVEEKEFTTSDRVITTN